MIVIQIASNTVLLYEIYYCKLLISNLFHGSCCFNSGLTISERIQRFIGSSYIRPIYEK
jgi:hypothetical protein